MPRLQVIIASTRPERRGIFVGKWFDQVARDHGGFDVELVDLAEVDLPIFDEPRHPRHQDYENEHTEMWSDIVERADAFVFVTPEYNHGPPPSLVNAIDFLSNEWKYKPAGFVSYGGVSAGTRSVELTKQLLVTLKVMPIPEAVAIPFFNQHLDADAATFDPGDVQVNAGHAMLDELTRWHEAMKTLRQ